MRVLLAEIHETLRKLAAPGWVWEEGGRLLPR